MLVWNRHTHTHRVGWPSLCSPITHFQIPAFSTWLVEINMRQHIWKRRFELINHMNPVWWFHRSDVTACACHQEECDDASTKNSSICICRCIFYSLLTNALSVIYILHVHIQSMRWFPRNEILSPGSSESMVIVTVVLNLHSDGSSGVDDQYPSLWAGGNDAVQGLIEAVADGELSPAAMRREVSHRVGVAVQRLRVA